MAGGSRGPDSDAVAALLRAGASSGSACTAVGAELRELADSTGWLRGPPGFIAAESSRAPLPVEANWVEM